MDNPTIDKKPMVYIAGPITKGIHEINIRNGIDATRQLRVAGFIPFCPMLDTLYAIVYPDTTYEEFLDYDFQVILHCDALYRIPGESSGADREEAFARANGIPVFHDFDSLASWKAFRYGQAKEFSY